MKAIYNFGNAIAKRIADRCEEVRLTAHDPTTAAIVDQVVERDRLLRAEIDRLTKAVDAEFEKGYDQAVREIHDHFLRVGQRDVCAEIEKIFGRIRSS